jgi:4-oxalocrotonate tautomerase
MPIIEMHLLVGRTAAQKRNAASAITEAVCGALDVKAEQVRILITEHGAEEFAVGGMTVGQRNEGPVAATNQGVSQ